ncbi:unnamed protein product [Amoebophrya sp. A120]|nr:unnamed protein product [Amoebophrya sp. A120]|eukprot:GSA120T00014163001.1
MARLDRNFIPPEGETTTYHNPSTSSSSYPTKPTPTTLEQEETEEKVLNCFKQFLLNQLGNKPNAEFNTETDETAIKIHKEKHLNYLQKAIFSIPQQFSGLDASRPWFVYWILHALELLREEEFIERNVTKERVRTFLMQCFHDSKTKTGCSSASIEADGTTTTTTTAYRPGISGGFGGGPRQLTHLATTYASVAAMCISGAYRSGGEREEAITSNPILDRSLIYRFLLSRKDPVTGGFSMHDEGELDIRGTYCAIAVASMLHILTPELAKDVDKYVLSHQSWDGGLSGEPGLEAHGGYSYCGFASLCILGVDYLPRSFGGKSDNSLDLERLLHWLSHRQMQAEGGYQGRTNKLVDSCYSFWQGTTFVIMRHCWEMLHAEQRNRNKNSADGKNNLLLPDLPKATNWSMPEPLQMYVFLACQEEEKGGLRDKPGKRPDYYHTCYSLSGVSAAQNIFETTGEIGFKENLLEHTAHVSGDKQRNKVKPIDPFYNVGIDKSFKMESYWAEVNKREPFKSPTLGELGSEGAGVKFWRKRFREFTEKDFEKL